ncbi:hypothetical protein [Methylobacterium segetis]|uniref:hypothetical protein n=1 Tax=Methylobacterium segetis TaxID=2488750 RepID=UPI001FDFDD9F|nr:hypothetical protein [Methylobacterium segetis]
MPNEPKAGYSALRSKNSSGFMSSRAFQPPPLENSEKSELRLQLAEAQEQCIEMAVDAGDLQAEIKALRAQLADVEQESDE